MDTYGGNMAEPTEQIQFYPEQVKWLEKMFPEQIFGSFATEAELRHHNAQRAVVATVRSKMKPR